MSHGDRQEGTHEERWVNLRRLAGTLGAGTTKRTCPACPCDEDCEVCCFGDLNCDEDVGISDLLDLLAAWGPCPAPPTGCDADLDCNGTVGIPDLLLLLAVWGTCVSTAPSEIPQTVEDCYDRFYPSDLDALVACIEAIGG